MRPEKKRIRPEKTAIGNDIRAWLSGAAYIILTDYRGLKVRQTDDLRKRLAKVRAQLHVVPNRLCKRVIADLKWEAADQALVGPTALVSGSGDVVEAAKLLQQFKDDNRLPLVKLGRFDGRYYTPADIAALVELPSRPVLYAMLAGTVAAPMSGLVGVLQQKLASLVYVLQAALESKSNQAK